MGLPEKRHSLLIGSGHPSTGLYWVGFDPSTGGLGPATPAVDQPDLSFLVSSAQGTQLYAASENPDRVVALSIDPGAKRVVLLNQQPAGGQSPCHLVLDATGRTLITATYNGGTVSAFPILPDASIGPCTAHFQHEGSGPDSARQDRPHTHSVNVSPDNRFVYACDLGTDEVVVYALGEAPGELRRAPVPPGRVPPGHGPRHARISADGRFLYVLNELIGSITTFTRDAQTGALSLLHTLSTLPNEHTGFNNSSEICLHPGPGEPFVYAANRGPDLLTVLRRDPITGKLTPLQHLSSNGAHPRHFALSPDGRWLICANRYSDELRTFALDPVDGTLTLTPHVVTLPQPCCVLFSC